jgi:hypothetical protein
VAQGGLVRTEDDGVICLYGVPTGGELAVDLFGPAGQVIGSAVFRVGPDPLGEISTFQVYPELTRPAFGAGPELAEEPIVGSSRVVDGLEITSISIWLPAGLPGGDWRVAARWLGGRVETPFAVVGPTQAIVNPMPDAPINPFREYRAANHAYQQGTEVRLQGAGFEANSTFPVGLYHLEGEDLGAAHRGVLSTGVMVQTDGQGSYATVVQTGGLQPGTYMVVSNPDGTDHGQGLSFFTVVE